MTHYSKQNENTKHRVRLKKYPTDEHYEKGQKRHGKNQRTKPNSQ